MRIEPRVRPMPNPRGCLNKFSLKGIQEFVTDISNVERNNFRGIPLASMHCFNKKWIAMLMVSSKDMLVNKLSISTLSLTMLVGKHKVLNIFNKLIAIFTVGSFPGMGERRGTKT